MSPAQQRRTIAVMAMLTFALGALSHAQKGELPTARFLIGTGGIFTIISIFADLGLAIGAAMSIVVATTALLTEGQGVIELLASRTREGKPQLGIKAIAPFNKGKKGYQVEVQNEGGENEGEVLDIPPLKAFGVGPKQQGFKRRKRVR